MKPGSVAKGIGTGAFLTLGGIGLGFWLAVIGDGRPGGIVLLWIGVAQLLWMLPAYVVYRRRGETETAKGLLIVTGLVFLLNASCWGFFWSNGVFRSGSR
jgi:hypothetical protein